MAALAGADRSGSTSHVVGMSEVLCLARCLAVSVDPPSYSVGSVTVLPLYVGSQVCTQFATGLVSGWRPSQE